jgi:hypothetical protein
MKKARTKKGTTSPRPERSDIPNPALNAIPAGSRNEALAKDGVSKLATFAPSITTKFIRVMADATKEETAFIDKFLDACLDGGGIQAKAFHLGASTAGFGFLAPYCDGNEGDFRMADLLKQAVFTLLDPNEHVSSAFSGMLHYREMRGRLTVEDMLFCIEDQILEERNAIEHARAILQSHPEVLVEDVCKLVAEHPEILHKQDAM